MPQKAYGLATIVSAACSIKKRLRNQKKQRNQDIQEKSWRFPEFSELLKYQKTFDNLDGKVLISCAGRIQEEQKRDLTFIAAKPTKELVYQFALSGFPDEMDAEHNLLLLAYDAETSEPLKAQLLSFGSAHQEMWKSLFDAGDYVVIKGEANICGWC